MASSVNTNKMAKVLQDFPDGPLTPFRQQASFNWKTMKLSIYDEESLLYIYDMWSFFETNELFSKPSSTLNFDERRHLSLKGMKAMKAFGCNLQMDRIIKNPRITSAWTEAVFTFNIIYGMRLGLSYLVFYNILQTLGTEKHYKYIQQSENDEIIGCLALTEVAHGSNAKGMMTTATYDVKTKQFILNSSSFKAAKFWIGCLGQIATHAIVYAKLITADGKDQGLHAFIVPIRSTKTMLPFPGVIVGDIGEKIAFNDLDNGFVMFNSYQISKDCLLNKFGDVSDNGKYTSPISDPNKRFGISLGGFLAGRVLITGFVANNLQKAIAIAIRYSTIRKQFGPDDSSEEFAIIEYQQQQFRLIPYIAVTYVFRVFHIWFAEIYSLFTTDNLMGNMRTEDRIVKSFELHAIASASKPITSWTVRDGIQECREACGGHGYLQASGIGKIRNENDANCTYEGDNTVLLQQTSNWLLSLMKKMEKGNKINTPYNSVNFLNDFEGILKSTCKIFSSLEAVDPEVLLNAYRWLVCYTLKITYNKVKRLSREGFDSFSIKNESQTYHSAILSTVFAQYIMLEKFCSFMLGVSDKNCKEILIKLASLYGAWSLEKHLSILYMGGYFTGEMGQLLRDGIINLCKTLKPEAVTLVDTLAPPDFILDSVLGNSDGRVYQNMEYTIFSNPGALARPSWWQDIIKQNSTNQSKL